MFRFKVEQKIFDIGGVRIGGQPGQLPTVLIGSIFHKGHRIVENPVKGVFDRKKAEKLIRLQEECSDRTGNPCMVDVVGENAEALKKYIDFISSITDAPILINGATSSVRVEASKYAVEIGLKNRVVYNSISFKHGKGEFEALKDMGLEAAVIQVFNPRDLTPKGMLNILTGGSGKPSLLKMAVKAGISKPLILTPVLDVPSIGLAAAGLHLVKNSLGLPAGCPPIGVLGRWRGSSSRIESFRAAAAALVQTMGANFIIYGSLSKAPSIFPACALVDAIIAYRARFSGIKPLTRNHPLYRFL